MTASRPLATARSAPTLPAAAAGGLSTIKARSAALPPAAFANAAASAHRLAPPPDSFDHALTLRKAANAGRRSIGLWLGGGARS
jgi:hypothetical protein